MKSISLQLLNNLSLRFTWMNGSQKMSCPNDMPVTVPVSAAKLVLTAKRHGESSGFINLKK